MEFKTPISLKKEHEELHNMLRQTDKHSTKILLWWKNL